MDAWQDGSSKGYARNLRTALDILKNNLPRTFVNLIPMTGGPGQRSLPVKSTIVIVSSVIFLNSYYNLKTTSEMYVASLTFLVLDF